MEVSDSKHIKIGLAEDVMAMEASGISSQDLILLTDFTSLPEIVLALCQADSQFQSGNIL